MASISVIDTELWLLKVGSLLVDSCLFWLRLSYNLIFYWVHNFLSVSDTRVTSWEKVGRAVFDSGKFDCALKNPNQHTPYAAIQRKTYFMVSTLWPWISTWHEWCGREVHWDDKMRIICTGKLFAIVINNPWHIITEKLNPWTELYMFVSHKQGRKYIF